jgi:outer membrane protein assembly factor BamB
MIVAAFAASAAVYLLTRTTPRPAPATPTTTTATPPAPAPPPLLAPRLPPLDQPPDSRVYWPNYGYDAAHTRAAPYRLRPPYRQTWIAHGRSLIELPPAVAYGKIYFGTNPGQVFAVETQSGRVAWKLKLGRCLASSPAVAAGVVYLAYMDPAPCRPHQDSLGGGLLALAADSGRVLWRRSGAVSESSPTVVGHLLYYGDWSGRVSAIDTRTHKLRWSFQTGGKVKGAVAYAGGRVFFGSYDSRVYCLDAQSGRELWATAVDGSVYANPALGYGKAFISTTAGTIYALASGDGQVVWRRQTSGYVYASAALYRGRVYVGSYDGRFYALYARDGSPSWEFDAHGAISGSPTVLSGLVYVSTLNKRTYALDSGSGKERWEFADGQYNPLVADSKQAYLVGEARVYGLTEK